MSHLLWLVPCLFKGQSFSQGIVTGNFLIFQETEF